MSMFSKNDERPLDEAVAQVVAESIDPIQMEAAAARVWEKLSQEGAVALDSETAPAASFATLSASTESASALSGCDSYQALIPSYLRGELPAARKLLFEDHTRGCVPCRRALREAREGKTATPVVTPAPANSNRFRVFRYAAAAAVLATAGTGLYFVASDLLAGGSDMARVESIEGSLYRFDGSKSEVLGAGFAIDEGDDVRTARGSRAFLRMKDGSLIEMGERAELSLDADRAGNTIELDRGKVLIQAAKQRPRHLFVKTDDCLVSVTGTIFAVNHGTKGSRVSVVEGEVHVASQGKKSVLHRGGQVATHASVATVPVGDEVAWSRDSARWNQLLAEVTAAGQEIDAAIGTPSLRTSTKLLDLSPEGTRLFVALPNLAESLGETQRLLDQKLASSETLRSWWNQNLNSEREQEFRRLIAELSDFGRDLGPEIAIAVGTSKGADHDPEPVLLAEVENEASFRGALEQHVAALNDRAGKTVAEIIENPETTVGQPERVYLWTGNGLFAASPSPAAIARVLANSAAPQANPFVASAFRARVADAYRDGAGWLFSADLGALVGEHAKQADASGRGHEMAEKLGILDVDNFLIDRREDGKHTETRAALTFRQARRGVAAWLAEPSPSGALEFISAEANLAATFAVKDPADIVDELLAANEELAQHVAEFRREKGFDLRDDLAAPLGGEVAFAIDGPMLPNPSWKLVVEVYDPTRLQQTIATTIEKINRELAAEGKPGLVLAETSNGGRTYYSVTGGSSGFTVHYVFVDGYLIVAPSHVLLERAISIRASGLTLAHSDRLRGLLGRDGQVNVSALVYRNLDQLAAIGRKVMPKGALGADQSGVASLLLGQGPSLLYAYAEEDRIVFASTGEAGPMGRNLELLAGLRGILGAGFGGGSEK